MDLHSTFAQVEGTSDLLVRFALNKDLENISLPGREIRSAACETRGNFRVQAALMFPRVRSKIGERRRDVDRSRQDCSQRNGQLFNTQGLRHIPVHASRQGEQDFAARL